MSDPKLVIIPIPKAEPLHGTLIAHMTRQDMECFARSVVSAMVANTDLDDLREYVDDLARQYVLALAADNDMPKNQGELDARAIELLERWTRAHQADTQEHALPQKRSN